MKIIIDIQQIIRQAQQTAYRSINKAMLEAYWLVGKRIVEEEQQGESRATYGKATIKKLSQELQKEFGKGFSVINLQNMRLFFLTYSIKQTLAVKSVISTIPQTLSAELANPISETVSGNLKIPVFKLSWSHYQMLLRISDKAEWAFYEIEADKNKWSVREWKRQFDSALYLGLLFIRQSLSDRLAK